MLDKITNIINNVFSILLFNVKHIPTIPTILAINNEIDNILSSLLYVSFKYTFKVFLASSIFVPSLVVILNPL